MQKKNRKGFTLIELLAVIVILAIIALIAVPVIMNVITKARISAFEDSAYGIVKAGEMYYTNKLLDTEGMTEDQEFTVVNDVFKNTTSDEILDLSGNIPSSGKVTVTSEGKVALAISNGEYCIRKAITESKVKAEKLSDLGGTCNYKTETSPNPVFTTASDGTEVPACITINRKCSVGTKVGVKVNDSETKNFYVIKDESNELTLIMDRNTGDNGYAWFINESIDITNVQGPIVALAYLEERTSSWTNIPSMSYQVIDENNSYSPITRTNARARLLTMIEAEELGCTTSSGSCPAWLYENGGDYWTSSAYANNFKCAWYVGYAGDTNVSNVNDGSGDYIGGSSYGVRPVITISKTIL